MGRQMAVLTVGRFGWVLAVGLLAACQAAAPAGVCPLPGQARAVNLKMYFGRDVPGGGFVNDADWAGFAAKILTSAFPDGFTVYQALGQWRDPGSGAVVREQSFVVESVGAVSAGKVDAVVQAYRRAFRQVSVGLVSAEVCAVF
jgi:hypothetical protein